MEALTGLFEPELMGNNIGDAVLRQARKTPGATAVTFGHRTWTYSDLAEAAVAAAAGLKELGIRPGDRIAFFGRNSDVYLIGWLGTLLVGAVHVPVNFMLSAPEVAYILGHAEAIAAFADASLLSTLREATISVEWPLHVGILHEDAVVDDETPAFTSIFHRGVPYKGTVHDPEAIAQIAYTSGTESSPKGAMLSHRALMYQYLSCIIAGEYEAGDTMIHAMPLYHCAQMHCFLVPSLMLGSKNIILADAGPADLIDAIAEHQASSIFAPPTVWIGMLRCDRFTDEAIASLRKGYYGASIMPREIVRELSTRAPNVRLWNYYGQTEIAPLATVLYPQDQLDRIGSAGHPVIHVETRVVDEDMNDVATGEIGEVVHRSPQLMSGYYKDSERTAEAFSGGWFHSGDLARADGDGFLYIVDRKKDVINTGGENVSSREVEEAIYEHASVAEVAVVAMPDPKWIECVVAVVVLVTGTETTAEDIIAHTRERLAGYKVPKRVVFANQLPKNPSGKILKRALREFLRLGPRRSELMPQKSPSSSTGA